MVNKRSRFLIAAIATLFSIVVVAYSCSKAGSDAMTCNHVVCQNGGHCFVDTTKHKPFCSCAAGFEGTNCSVVSVTKYLGTWDLTQKITGCDSSSYIGQDSTYPVQLKTTATPTTFFISNFFNDKYYNDIVCTMDSINTSNFIIDTISSFHMVYDHYQMQSGYGTIFSADSIHAVMILRYKNKSTNWQVDTLDIVMKPHVF